MNYELKLATGKVVTWEGKSEEDAARRYVDCFKDAAVVATQPVPTGIYIYNPNNNTIE